MQDLIHKIDTIRATSTQFAGDVSSKYRLPSDNHFSNAFTTCSKQAILSMELLAFYDRVWSKPHFTTLEDTQLTRQENAERIMTLTKAMFVLSISAIEYSAKNVLTSYPSTLAPITGRVYLRKIISQSAKAGFFPSNKESQWAGVIEIRNMVVHNNGISEVTETYSYPNGLTIALNSGKMTRGSLNIFAELTQWSVYAYAQWCDAFLKSTMGAP